MGDDDYKVVYDTNVYSVDVKVEKNGTALVASASCKKNGAAASSIEFTNKVTKEEKEEVVTPASLSIPVTKVIDGTAPAGSKFTFKLAGKDGAPMPAGDTVQVTVGAEGRGSNAFGSISYNEAGTYSYTVTELVDSDASTEGGTTY